MTQRHPHSTAPGRSPSRTVAAPHAPLPAADQANASQADPPGLTFSVSVSALQHLIIEVLRRPVEFTQYTAIDDATRIRALRVYRRHTQQNAIAFADDVIRTCPFRIHTVRTDRGHAFQALLHWHLADQGIQHVDIKPRTPHLNGTVERSHRTDQQECYQLLSDKGAVDLEQRLAEWERFYNFGRPHGAFAGQTPYEALRERLPS